MRLGLKLWIVYFLVVKSLCTLAVHILSRKRSAVVRDGAITHHCADRSLHLSTSNLYIYMVISLNYL